MPAAAAWRKLSYLFWRSWRLALAGAAARLAAGVMACRAAALWRGETAIWRRVAIVAYQAAAG